MKFLIGLICGMEAFLRHVDKDIAREIVPLNTASFYWSGNEALRKEFYGV